MMKRNLIIAALLAALAAAAVAMRSTARQNEGAPAYPPVKVALAPALREQAARSYAGVGELEAASQVAVAAETSGRITRILPSNRAKRCSRGSCWCSSTMRWNRPS